MVKRALNTESVSKSIVAIKFVSQQRYETELLVRQQFDLKPHYVAPILCTHGLGADGVADPEVVHHIEHRRTALGIETREGVVGA